MKLLYFAWVRERIGVAEEDLALPVDVATVGGLLDHLERRGGGYRAALEDRRAIRLAVNQEHVEAGHPLGPNDEVAIFPPVTGG